MPVSLFTAMAVDAASAISRIMRSRAAGVFPATGRGTMPLQISDSSDQPTVDTAATPKTGRRRSPGLLLALTLAGAPLFLLAGALALSLFKPYIVELGWGSFAAGVLPRNGNASLGWQRVNTDVYEGGQLGIPAGKWVWCVGAARCKHGKWTPVKVAFLE